MATFSFGKVTTTPDQPIAFGGAPFVVDASNITLDLTPWSTNPGPANVTGTLTITKGSDTATFALTSPGILSFDPITKAAGFVAPVILTSSPTSITGSDLSPFLGGGVFTLSFQSLSATPDDPGVLELQQGSTGSFTLSANPVPEPASLALWGSLALAGLCFARRRLARIVPTG
jgi:hypothetical protein